MKKATGITLLLFALILGTNSSGQTPTQAPSPFVDMRNAHPGYINISGDVISGRVARAMILKKQQPKYPPDAKENGVQGTVVLMAAIDETGAIVDLTVVSGPPLLCDAAFNAVKHWQYRPYLLNGKPVGVFTTINVVFSLAR